MVTYGLTIENNRKRILLTLGHSECTTVIAVLTSYTVLPVSFKMKSCWTGTSVRLFTGQA